jgi:hypothetical protein
MNTFKKSTAYDALNVIILLFIIGFAVYSVIVFVLFVSTVIDPAKTARLAQTNTLFHLVPKMEIPEIEISSTNPNIDVEVKSIMAYLNFRMNSRIYHVLTFVPYMIWLALYLLIFVKLRGFLLTLREGDPFIHENAGRIRTVGIIVLICELLRMAKDFSVVFYLEGNITSRMFDVTTLPLEFYLEYLRLDLIFIGLAVLVFSEIFRLGAIMREEQRLTI